jgi:hypothetical protein
MDRYYFDIREGDELARDDTGLKFQSLSAAHDDALRALTTMVKDSVVQGHPEQSFAIEVRDGAGPVIEVRAEIQSRVLR